jgi:itaconyl-CoA hydratase
VLCTVVGLSVEDLSEAGGPFLGISDVVFHHPVYAGDTVTARSVVTDMRESEKRPQFGIVTWRTEGRNQKGQTVVGYERANLIMKRSSS